MSLDRGLRLVKIGRNSYRVSDVNLSTRCGQHMLTTTNLHEALRRIEEEQAALPYESLEVSGFSSLAASALPEAVRLSKEGPNVYRFQLGDDGGVVSGPNLHQLLQLAQAVKHGGLQIVGFSRQVAGKQRGFESS